ncbi:MAG: multiheme c-type cytochrome [Gemmatimonadaceae bacterium]
MIFDDRSRGPRHLFRWLAALLLVAAGVSAVLFLAARRRPQRWPDAVRTETAMGDSTCLSCHTDKASYEGTAHRLTTRHPSRATILGSFERGANLLKTPNPSLHFRMDRDSAGFLETAVYGKAPDTTSRTERIAYVAGSGRKGQSFLYWKGDQLFQLPVSYWTSLGTWINSPGPAYVDGAANFDRAVAPRCLECHATWMEPTPDVRFVNRFRAEGAILGITCERCHAAGKEHVENQRSVLNAVRPVRIVNPARLSRARKIEACAQCHSGLGQPIVPSFTYVAGQPLEKYLYLRPLPLDAQVDVHGNQVALLSRSKCFRASEMTCMTCHDVHRTQRNTAELSGRCLTCHQEQSCGLFPKQGHALKGRCVDCHMPLQTSNTLVSSLDGKKETVQVRNHWIKVYRDSAGQ